MPPFTSTSAAPSLGSACQRSVFERFFAMIGFCVLAVRPALVAARFTCGSHRGMFFFKNVQINHKAGVGISDRGCRQFLILIIISFSRGGLASAREAGALPATPIVPSAIRTF